MTEKEKEIKNILEQKYGKTSLQIVITNSITKGHVLDFLEKHNILWSSKDKAKNYSFGSSALILNFYNDDRFYLTCGGNFPKKITLDELKQLWEGDQEPNYEIY